VSLGGDTGSRYAPTPIKAFRDGARFEAQARGAMLMLARPPLSILYTLHLAL